MDTIHRTVLERLKVIIRLLYKEGYDVYLTGMADGFDIWGGEAVLEMQSELPDLKLVAVPAYIPRTTKDTAYYRMYARIMAASAQVYEVCPEYKRDCFDRRNEVLVSNCSTLVCYFDGIKGGTANTIAKARKRDLRIINHSIIISAPAIISKAWQDLESELDRCLCGQEAITAIADSTNRPDTTVPSIQQPYFFAFPII